MEGRKYKILIVDDDKFLLNMYSAKFKKFGHEIEAEATSEGALDKLKEGYDPDIVIIDIVMPFMDGLQLLEEIKKQKLAPNAVFIMLTNQASAPEIEKAKALGIGGYIVKATSIPSEVVDMVLKITRDNK
jgi:CheY-like chemotaxis protein